jgi:toxin-antitoxin system PIN domain toxin
VILTDVNVLVHAHREDSPQHRVCARWLQAIVDGDAAFGMSELVLGGFVRIVTHPKVFTDPSPLKDALAFAEQLRSLPHCVIVRPGDRHWEIFSRLCREAGVRGNLVPDAYLAALAIESGSEWITTDRDFSRFKGLRWRTPAAQH